MREVIELVAKALQIKSEKYEGANKGWRVDPEASDVMPVMMQKPGYQESPSHRMGIPAVENRVQQRNEGPMMWSKTSFCQLLEPFLIPNSLRFVYYFLHMNCMTTFLCHF